VVGGSEHVRAICRRMVAELDCPVAGGSIEHAAKLLPPLNQLCVSKILTVQMQQIEDIEQQPVRLVLDRIPERGVVRDAVLVLHDHFAVEDGGSAAQVRGGTHDAVQS
jgi:hypothetical protein